MPTVGRGAGPGRYSGDWYEGERSGFGVWTGPTGDDYKVRPPPLLPKLNDGSHSSERPSSPGSPLMNLPALQGEYRRDKRNGVGVYMFASGRHPRACRCAQREALSGGGAGASGATYEGDFKDGKPNGVGVYTFRSGKRTLDTYRNGEEVSSKPFTNDIGAPLIAKSKDAATGARASAERAQAVLDSCTKNAKEIEGGLL